LQTHFLIAWQSAPQPRTEVSDCGEKEGIKSARQPINQHSGSMALATEGQRYRRSF